jgi:hypothetical protein
MSRQLVFVSWCDRQAAYLDGKWVHYGEQSVWPPRGIDLKATRAHDLLLSLGYDVRFAEPVPDPVPREFGRNAHHHWAPPDRLADVELQRTAYLERLRREQIVSLRKQLAALEAEDKSAGAEELPEWAGPGPLSDPLPREGDNLTLAPGALFGGVEPTTKEVE